MSTTFSSPNIKVTLPINLLATATINYGAIDPTVAGFPGTIGDIYIGNTEIFQKTTSNGNDTNWVVIYKSGILDMNNNKIINLSDPTSDLDAANKEYVDTHSGGGGGETSNTYILNPTDVANKYITLVNTPTNPTMTLLTVVGGPMQDYGPDFVVSGNQLNWNGLFLDGVLTTNDILIVESN